MYKYILFPVILLTQLLAGYNIGDTISLEDQEMEFSFCYPADSLESIFSFVEHSGKVIMLERSAAW